jgi:hypothetical protein
MLDVTDAAAALLKEMLNQAGPVKGKTARLAVGKRGTELVLDTERPGDAKISHEGETVLVYDKELAEMFESKTLDAQVTEGGSALVFR